MKIAFIMGSENDRQYCNDGINLLKEFSIEHDILVMSAHRTPEKVREFSKNARKNGFSILICAAGKSACLSGMVSAYSTLPVIGLPIKSSFMDGLDSLLSTVQMPSGVPVASVGINSSINAVILAVRVLAIYDKDILAKLEKYKEKMNDI